MLSLILGSQSPRRKEILSFFDIPFKQVSPLFDEEAVPWQNNPEEYVKTLSKGKADSLGESYTNDLILTADTIVYKDKQVYNKPTSREEAFAHLKALSGGWHSVFTGLTVRHRGEDFQAVEETRVLIHPLTDQQMHLYHQSLPFLDKAGGYMIQGAGSLIVARIDGCYYNAMGLPVNALYKTLKQAGVDLWQHLKGIQA